MIRGLATLAFALVLAGCGATAPASPSTAATPAPSALAAGTYTSVTFKPAVTFTVGDGWELPSDALAYMLVRPVGDQNNGIHFFHNPQALSQATDCPAAAQPNVGTTSVELITWIRSLKGLVVGTPAMVTVGGLPATSIDVGIADGWTQSCPFANGAPTVPLFYGQDSGLRWIVVGNERLRLSFVDVPNAGLVVVDIDAFDGTQFNALLSAASPVVKSLKIAAG